MLHFIAAHKIAAVITTVVIAGGIGGTAAKQSSDAAHAKQVHHALIVKQQKAAAVKAQAAQAAAANAEQATQAKEVAISDAADKWTTVGTDIGTIAGANGNWTMDMWNSLSSDSNSLKMSLTALRPYLTAAQQAILDANAGPLTDELSQAAAAGNADDYVSVTENLSMANSHLTPVNDLLTSLGAVDSSGNPV
jgi:hypothetical protein